MKRILYAIASTALLIFICTACDLQSLMKPLGDLHIKAKLEAPANTDAATMDLTVQAINKRLEAHGIRSSDITSSISGNKISYEILHADDEHLIARILTSQAQLELRPLVEVPKSVMIFDQLRSKVIWLQNQNELRLAQDEPAINEENIQETDDLLFEEEIPEETETIQKHNKPVLIITNLYEDQVDAKAHVSDTALVNEAIGKLRISSKPSHQYQFKWALFPDEEQMLTLYLLEASPLLSGDFVESSSSTIEPQTGQPIVSFQMIDDAAKIWASYTKTACLTHSRVAIILDGRVYTAPSVAAPILNGACQISGHFTENEAQDLSNILTAPLACPVYITSMQTTQEN